jgi:hypothetical protein
VGRENITKVKKAEAYIAALGIAEWWICHDDKGLMVLAIAMLAMFAGDLAKDIIKIDKIRGKVR